MPAAELHDGPLPGHPTLETPRLLLRRFEGSDAADVHRLVSDPDVATPTLNIPHPYPAGAAEAFIAARHTAFERGEGLTFAVVERASGELVGAVGLATDARHARAELGYWIGKPYWSRGYATEAARAVVAWAFGALGLRRVWARHFPRNPTSGRVLRKLGMRHEGRLRQHVQRDGVFEDLECYGILREEFEAGGQAV